MGEKSKNLAHGRGKFLRKLGGENEGYQVFPKTSEGSISPKRWEKGAKSQTKQGLKKNEKDRGGHRKWTQKVQEKRDINRGRKVQDLGAGSLQEVQFPVQVEDLKGQGREARKRKGFRKITPGA